MAQIIKVMGKMMKGYNADVTLTLEVPNITIELFLLSSGFTVFAF